MSEMLDAPPCGALKSMYWRSEILQVMYWMRGEGFGDDVNPRQLERFLGVDAAVGIQYLDQLVEEGMIERIGDRYGLSELGRQEGGFEFAASFEELQGQTHGECGPDCPHCFPPDGVETDCEEGCPAFQLAMENAASSGRNQ